jgi:hypothetical protein
VKEKRHSDRYEVLLVDLPFLFQEVFNSPFIHVWSGGRTFKKSIVLHIPCNSFISRPAPTSAGRLAVWKEVWSAQGREIDRWVAAIDF